LVIIVCQVVRFGQYVIKNIQNQPNFQQKIKRGTDNSKPSAPSMENIDELYSSEKKSFHKLDYDNCIDAVAIHFCADEQLSNNESGG